MTSTYSYNITSLLSLRSQAIQPPHFASAEQLNLWLPTAQHNAHGHTQPFPFQNYTRGIGQITIIPNHIHETFADMSWDTPVGVAWSAIEAQPEVSSVVQESIAATSTDATVVTADVTADETTGEPKVETTTGPVSRTASEVRKSSLADLANGDRDAINAHLAQGLGPHMLLSRFASQKSMAGPDDTASASPVSNIKVTEADGAASVIDDLDSNTSTSAMATKNENSQTAPDTTASELFTATPAGSVTDGDKSVPQSPRPVRKPGPHHRLQGLALARDIPLPQSPAPIPKSPASDKALATTVATAVNHGPAIIPASPSAVAPTTENGSESDTAFIDIKTELSDHEKDLDPKANAWTPEVEHLPSSCPVSPSTTIKLSSHESEAGYINACFPVPMDWSVPTIIEAFANGDLFDGPCLGGIHKAVLSHYSHYFATTFASGNSDEEEEHARLIKDPAFAVFRQWVFGRTLYAKSNDGTTQRDMNIDLKSLVQLWRFGARIQAPLFANTVATAMIAKVVTADDVFAAAKDIDAVLKMISANNTFRLLISHIVILSKIKLDLNDYEIWPKSLIWSMLAWLDMGKGTYANYPSNQLLSKTQPCIYHLHPLGRICKS